MSEYICPRCESRDHQKADCYAICVVCRKADRKAQDAAKYERKKSGPKQLCKSPEKIEKVLTMINAGKSRNQIARVVGAHKTTVARVVNAHLSSLHLTISPERKDLPVKP